jgi:hypothetical protein
MPASVRPLVLSHRDNIIPIGTPEYINRLSHSYRKAKIYRRPYTTLLRSPNSVTAPYFCSAEARLDCQISFVPVVIGRDQYTG